jgi:hypothetical protein
VTANSRFMGTWQSVKFTQLGIRLPSPTSHQMYVENLEEASQPHTLSEFNTLQETLLTNNVEEGWVSELHHYLSIMQQDITKETDLVEWWQVWNL